MNAEGKHPPAAPLTGTLFVVGTPIGNLEDITLRALRILREADLIAAEDTRQTRKLLSHYDVHTPLVSYHEHNKRSRTPQLTAKLKGGTRVALVSDAGMPGISDPGQELIASAIKGGIEVTVIPGPNSIISALVLSGLSTDMFCFLGFPPRKTGERRRFVEDALQRRETSIMFESPARLVALLEMIASLAPDRKIVVARELTKKFEQVLRGTATELLTHFLETPPRGEFVVLTEGAAHAAHAREQFSPADAPELVKSLMAEEGLGKKEAMREAAKRLGVSRREVYRALLESEEKR
ncbi:MAG: 16S rRNA (cytidine(1402)-2'-O)-methyltransferase [Candidatus Abyssubacteria bacterium]